MRVRVRGLGCLVRVIDRVDSHALFEVVSNQTPLRFRTRIHLKNISLRVRVRVRVRDRVGVRVRDRVGVGVRVRVRVGY